MQYAVAFCHQLEEDSDVISGGISEEEEEEDEKLAHPPPLHLGAS